MLEPRYTLSIKRSAEKELDRLPPSDFSRVTTAILQLESTPRPNGSKKLHASQSYRIRIGELRVLYDIDDNARTIIVIAVRKRGAAYRP